MKKVIFKKVVIIVMLLMIALHLTPKTSLAFKLFITGHPIVAFTSSPNNISDTHGVASSNIIVYYLENPPISRNKIKHKYYTWVSRKIGPFYISYYYGEG